MSYPKLLTVSETATRLRKSQRTLKRWRDQVPMSGPAYIRVGYRIMYAESDVNRWLLEHRKRGK